MPERTRPASVAEYLASLPPDRRATLEAVRRVVLANLDRDYAEGIQYGMIGYFVPHSVYPAGYHCDPRQPLPFAALGSQKNHISLHLMCVYGHAEHDRWFREAWARTGKKLDMGKACIRFRKIEDVALEVIGEAIRRVPAAQYIEYIEKLLGDRKKSPGEGKKSPGDGKKSPGDRKKSLGDRKPRPAGKSKATRSSSAKKATGAAAKGKPAGGPASGRSRFGNRRTATGRPARKKK